MTASPTAALTGTHFDSSPSSAHPDDETGANEWTVKLTSSETGSGSAPTPGTTRIVAALPSLVKLLSTTAYSAASEAPPEKTARGGSAYADLSSAASTSPHLCPLTTDSVAMTTPSGFGRSLSVKAMPWKTALMAVAERSGCSNVPLAVQLFMIAARSSEPIRSEYATGPVERIELWRLEAVAERSEGDAVPEIAVSLRPARPPPVAHLPGETAVVLQQRHVQGELSPRLLPRAEPDGLGRAGVRREEARLVTEEPRGVAVDGAKRCTQRVDPLQVVVALREQADPAVRLAAIIRNVVAEQARLPAHRLHLLGLVGIEPRHEEERPDDLEPRSLRSVEEDSLHGAVRPGQSQHHAHVHAARHQLRQLAAEFEQVRRRVAPEVVPGAEERPAAHLRRRRLLSFDGTPPVLLSGV